MAEIFYERAHGAHPYSLAGVRQNHLARMLPMGHEQVVVYEQGSSHPAGLEGYAPTWEVISGVLAAQSTLQMRVSVQRDFHILALIASSSSVVNGGFRAQLYDNTKLLRFADRGVPFANIAGSVAGGFPGCFFLREPYEFDQPNSLVLVMLQNLELVTNTAQIVLYGVARRFNDNQPVGTK